AVSGVATRLLAREDAVDLAIVGSGIQARSHLAALAAVRPLRRVRVASRRLDHARRFADEMGRQHGFPIEPVETVEEALRAALLAAPATDSAEPVVKREWIAKGAHLNVGGASVATKREVASATMAASRLFVDRRESTVNEAGDYL